MAAWHPYPFAAMMGSRSRLEQPGFIANIPSWGGGLNPGFGGGGGPRVPVGSGRATFQGRGGGAYMPGAITQPGYPLGVGGPLLAGASRYPEQGGYLQQGGYPLGGGGQPQPAYGQPGGYNDPFLNWIRQQYGQYYGQQQPGGGYPIQAY